MIPLIRKDFFLIRKGYLLTSILTTVISVMCIYWEVDAGGVYILNTLLAFIIMGYGGLVSDQEDEASYFLLTLPVSKRVFVLSKYMSCVIISALIWLTTSVILLIIRLVSIFDLKIAFSTIYSGLVWCVALNIIFCAFLLPAYYLLGYKGTRFLILIPVLAASFSSQIVNSTFVQKLFDQMSQLSTEIALLLFLICCLIVYTLSYIVSLSIVKRKAF